MRISDSEEYLSRQIRQRLCNALLLARDRLRGLSLASPSHGMLTLRSIDGLRFQRSFFGRHPTVVAATLAGVVAFAV